MSNPELHHTYLYFEEKSFRITGKLFKKALILGSERERAFNFTYNNFTKKIYEIKKKAIQESNPELAPLLLLFKNRGQYYENNSIENIIKHELYDSYKKNKIRNTKTFKDVIFRIAIHEGLSKAISIISSNSNYYSLLVKYQEIENFTFIKNHNEISKLERSLINKHTPSLESDSTTIDLLDASTPINEMSNHNLKTKTKEKIIILHGIEFNIYEFALYQKEWKNCNAKETALREIYDKVLMDFNDPYSYGSKRYDSTPFYKILKEDYLNSKQNFDVLLAYQKVLKLTKKTKNNNFKEHIDKKLSKAQFKFG